MRRFESSLGLALLLVGCSVDLVGCSVDFSGQQKSPFSPAPFPTDGGFELDAEVRADGSPPGKPVPEGGLEAGIVIPEAGADAAPILRSCGTLPHGAREQRERYPAAVVPQYADCMPEVQVRRCEDGVLSAWSGTAQETSCAVALFGRCNDMVACAQGECVNGKTFPFLDKYCLASNGMACGNDTDCVERCIGGSCAAPSSAGGACDTAGDCALLACLGATGGASCEDATCVCPAQAFCTDNAQCQGTCVGRRCAAFDEACDPGDADDCSPLASCIGGRCRRPDGAPCTRNSQCENVCRGDQCAPVAGFGEPCDQHADCGTGLACALSRPQPDCRGAPGTSCQNGPECASLTCACEGEGEERACICAEN